MITSGLADGKKPKATKKAPPKPKEEVKEVHVEILPIDARDELFCNMYVKLRGNATRAYMEAFGHTNYQSA